MRGEKSSEGSLIALPEIVRTRRTEMTVVLAVQGISPDSSRGKGNGKPLEQSALAFILRLSGAKTKGVENQMTAYLLTPA